MSGNNQGAPELPVGWTLASLEDIAEIIRGISFKKDQRSSEYGEGRIACLRTTNVQKNVEWGNLWFVPTELVKKQTQLLQLNDILISMSNSLELVGKVAQASVIPRQSTIGAFISIIRVAQELDPIFVYNQMASHNIQSAIRKTASTTTNISNISTSSLNKTRFKMPPLPEQHRIVTKIEELFTNLDAGVVALKMVQAQIKRYRQAVLKYAFEGKLTLEWREAHKEQLEPASVLLERIREERKKKLGGKYKEPVAVDPSDLPKLPDGWEWTNLEQLSWDSGYGTSEKCGYEKDGVPVVRIPNVVGGEVNLDDLKYADAQMQVKDYDHLDLGDILIIRTNGSRDLIGRAAVISKEFDQRLFFASYLIRYRIVDVGSLASWIAHIWHCPQVRIWIEASAATTAGQYNINIAKLNRLPIALPPLEEQEHIINELDRRFTLHSADRNLPQLNYRMPLKRLPGAYR